MTNPFHAVAGGVQQTNAGFVLTGWAVAAVALLFWFIDRGLPYLDCHEEFRQEFVALFGVLCVVAVGGVVFGLLGRCRCFALPPDLPAARGWLKLAVALEGCGWGGLLVGAGILFAKQFWRFRVEPWVPAGGMGLSALMLFSGRVAYLRFLRALARVVDDPASDRRGQSALALFLVNWAVGLVGLGALWGGEVLGLYRLTTPLGYLIWTAAGLSGLAGLIVYDRLLGGLGRSVALFADDLDAAPDESPDADEG